MLVLLYYCVNNFTNDNCHWSTKWPFDNDVTRSSSRMFRLKADRGAQVTVTRNAAALVTLRLAFCQAACRLYACHRIAWQMLNVHLSARWNSVLPVEMTRVTKNNGNFISIRPELFVQKSAELRDDFVPNSLLLINSCTLLAECSISSPIWDFYGAPFLYISRCYRGPTQKLYHKLRKFRESLGPLSICLMAPMVSSRQINPIW